jgi:hypothetical protein
VMDVWETPRDRTVEKLRRVGLPATVGRPSCYARLQGAGRRCARRRKRGGGRFLSVPLIMGLEPVGFGLVSRVVV